MGELLADGLHFTAEGNRLCFRLVLDKIKEVYPDLDPAKTEKSCAAVEFREGCFGGIEGEDSPDQA